MATTIKRIASEAKRRLKNGYWEELYKCRDEDLRIAQEKGVSRDFIVDTYKQKLPTGKQASRLIFQDEEGFYSKVYDIVVREGCGETVRNPIGILKDENYYNTLDDYGKQRYILNLSDVYISVREKIEREFKIKSLKE